MNTSEKRPTPRTDTAKKAYCENGSPITEIFEPMAQIERELADVSERLRLAEDTCSAVHAAMLGKVHPKSPAWALIYAVQDRGIAARKTPPQLHL